MREVLFRGKLKNGMRIGEWVEGFFVEFVYPPTKEKETYIQTLKDDGTLCLIHEVDPETVGQYTGLRDKNGRRIFEGDIVQIEDFTHGCALNYKQPTSKWVVHWRKDTARFCIDYMSLLPFDFTQSEIIGNIHDNPELMEVR